MKMYLCHRREIKLLMSELDEEKKMRLSLQVNTTVTLRGRVPNHMPCSLFSPHKHHHRSTVGVSQTTCASVSFSFHFLMSQVDVERLKKHMSK